jgi:hypothetical protein
MVLDTVFTFIYTLPCPHPTTQTLLGVLAEWDHLLVWVEHSVLPAVWKSQGSGLVAAAVTRMLTMLLTLAVNAIGKEAEVTFFQFVVSGALQLAKLRAPHYLSSYLPRPLVNLLHMCEHYPGRWQVLLDECRSLVAWTKMVFARGLGGASQDTPLIAMCVCSYPKISSCVLISGWLLYRLFYNGCNCL